MVREGKPRKIDALKALARMIVIRGKLAENSLARILLAGGAELQFGIHERISPSAKNATSPRTNTAPSLTRHSILAGRPVKRPWESSIASPSRAFPFFTRYAESGPAALPVAESSTRPPLSQVRHSSVSVSKRYANFAPKPEIKDSK